MASLTFKGVQLYDTATPPTRRFWITEGGPADEEWEVRGVDDTISTAPGQEETNRVKHKLPIVAEGYINGVGADIAAQRVSYQQTLALLHTVLQTDGVIGPLVWVAPDGVTYTIQARFIAKSRGDWQNGVFRRFTLEFESIAGASWA